MEKYTIIISFDAVDEKDFQILKDMPNFKYLIQNGSYSSNVESVYPSLTYPAHTTIVTGNYPNNHGIINNTLLQPKRKSPDWYWYRKDIKGTTLYDLAKENGLKTASLLWPVTAKANIDYNMPEIFPNRLWQNQIFTSLCSGSKLFQLLVNKKFGKLRKGLAQPFLDNFVMASALYLIEKKRPNLFLIHLTDVDHFKHNYGCNSNKVLDALKRHDLRLGKIINLLKKINIFHKTTIIALGDHGHLNTQYVIKLNKLFLEKGFISLNNNGEIKDWDVFLNSCDGSAYIYLKNNNDNASKEKVIEDLKIFSKENNNCINKILSVEEASSFGADEKCFLMLEAKKGYYFINSIKGNIIEKTDKDFYKANHGYCPKIKGYKTIFIASGPKIKKNYEIKEMRLIDEAPTIAKILELSLGQVDGLTLNEIFI